MAVKNTWGKLGTPWVKRVKVTVEPEEDGRF